MAFSLGGIAAGGLGLLGAVAGMQGDRSSQSYTKNVDPASALELQANGVLGSGLTDFQNIVNAGAGQQDMTASLQSQRQLAALLQQYSQGGFLPNSADMQQAQAFTQAMFAPQQTQLQQNFADATTTANRAAARMGRAGNDPILLNKLLQEQTRQQQTLNSQMTAFQAQQAQLLPQQRLDYANQYAQVQSGLASQALANRQALMSLGSQIKNQEQNFRLGTASTTATSSSGGGLMGALTGGLAAFGAGAKAVGSFGSLFSGGQSSPTATTGGSYTNVGNIA